MGEVYRAVDERLGRAVALKLLSRKQATADMQARLHREAQAASALNHPGIVTVHDIGAWQGQLYIVMELVDGESLADVARRGVAPEEALRLVASAADALGAAHARDILHRDVKSDNLMRTSDGRVKVLDFGLAKLRAPVDAQPITPSPPPSPQPQRRNTDPEMAALAATVSPEPSTRADPDITISSTPDPAFTPNRTPVDLTLAGSLVGTPAFMAPEQTHGGSGDAQSEVFSLGVVLYELATGKRPFDRGTIAETLEAIRSAELVPPSRAARERKIPPAVDEITLRALARDRAVRFRDMPALAAACRAALAAPAARRRRVALGALAAGLALLTGGGALVASRHHTPPPAPPATVIATRRLTFAKGCEEYPSFTPDGRTVVYDGLADGDYELLALDTEGGAPRRLTHAPGWDYGGAVSPDGARVAYIHLRDEGREIRVLPLTGDAAAPPTVLGFAVSFPAWSEAGEVVMAVDERIVRAPIGGTQSELARLPRGRQLRLLAPFRDGEMIAIWQQASESLEFVLGAIGKDGSVRELEGRLPYDQPGLAVAPSQEGFYYARYVGASNELLRRARAGGPPAVVGGVAPSSGFALSRDGKRLVYSTCRESIQLARARTGAPAVDLMPRGVWRDHFPVAVDDHRLLFTSDRSGTSQVWLLDLKTDEQRALTGRDTAFASLSPDRRRLVFSDSAAGLRVMALDGKTPPRPLTDEPTDAEAQFSFDGARVVFLRTSRAEGSRVYVVPVEGGTPRAISPVGALAPAVSPVEDRVLFVKETNEGRVLLATDLAGREPQRLPSLPPAAWFAPRVSPDGKRVLVIRKHTDVVELPVDGSAPPVTRWQAGLGGIESIDYAPDGDGYIMSLSSWDGDLWLAEGEFR
jgi:Tol biopolymer transport system component